MAIEDLNKLEVQSNPEAVTGKSPFGTNPENLGVDWLLLQEPDVDISTLGEQASERILRKELSNTYGNTRQAVKVFTQAPITPTNMFGFEVFYQNPSSIELARLSPVIAEKTAIFLAEQIGSGDGKVYSRFDSIKDRHVVEETIEAQDKKNDRWYKVSAAHIHDKVKVEITDITENKLREALKAAEAKALADREALAAIEEKNQKIEQELIILKENGELVSDHIGVATHDLRAPLTIIISQAQWAKRLIQKGDLDNGSEAIDLVIKNGWRMDDEITEIVHSAGALKAPELKPVSAVELIQTLAARRAKLTTSRKIEIKLEAPDQPVTFLGDLDFIIGGVLNTMVLNSVQALEGREDGIITLGCKQEGNRTLVYVKDNGIGMDEEGIAKCLDPYYTKKTQRSSGMGLANAVKRLSYFGGEFLKPESEINVGTTMTVAFPSYQETEQPTASNQ